MSVLLKTHLLDADERRFITPKGRMTFVAFAKKFKNKDAAPDDKGQYAGALIIPPTADISPLIADASDLARTLFGDKKIDFAKKGTYRGIKTPFLDAAERASAEELGLDSLEGYAMIRANSYRGPIPLRLASDTPVPIDEYEVEAYRGRYARFEVKTHGYKRSDGNGVKFYLQGVQLLGNAPKLKGGASVGTADNFGAVEDEDEDEDALA